MRKLFIITMVIVLTFATVTAFAQSAKEAILGLKKLQARCQSGISYQEYGNAVADAMFPVNLFKESEAAKESPELADSVRKVMFHYVYANEIWQYKFSSRSPTTLIGVDTEIGRDIEGLYPRASKIPGFIVGGPYYKIDQLLPVIWAEASEELDNATKLYAKAEKDKSDDTDKLKKENAKLKKQLELMKSKNKK